MPSLKDLRNRIASVKATQKITKAMQMVAAAKLRRAQEAARPPGPMRSACVGARQHRRQPSEGAARRR
jgi:ATP synthase F1 gamma subunit